MFATAAVAQLPLGLVKDIYPGSGLGSVAALAAMNGTLFFTANNGVKGDELWKSDGTAAGTVMVKDIVAGSGSASFRYPMVESNHVLFFGGDNGINGSELWRSDGTAAGTFMVKDIWPGVGNGAPGNFTDVAGTLYFTASDPIYGGQLWKTDGTTAGTVRVNDVSTEYFTIAPAYLTNVNGTLFFAAGDAASNGAQLWTSDGTAAGTVMVKDVNPAVSAIATSGAPCLFATSMGLYFAARTPDAGLELWKSDGTEGGTAIVKDINPGPGDANPGQVTEVNGMMFFTATDGLHGNELWVTDGTPGGTQMVLDINPGIAGSNPGNLVAFGDKLYFAADDGVHGSELWVSDGTPGGTQMVLDIWQGTSASTPNYLTVLGDKIYFSAWDGIHGHELWQSDGTSVGTQMVGDIMPGGNGSYPQRLTVVDGALFFTANDGTHGYELWKLGTINRDKPLITSVTPDLLAAVGDAVSLSVTATGAPEPGYQWLKNGVVIPGARQATYTIPGAVLGDGATYSVRVTNSSGSATGTVRLGVVDTAYTLVGVNNLTTAAMTVKAAGPGLTYGWNFNGVVADGRFSGAATRTLSIRRFTVDDQGDVFTCTVTMGALQMDSGSFQPMLRSKPDIEATFNPPVWNVSGMVSNAITDLIDVLNSLSSDYPTRFTVSGLPAGVTCNGATGQLSGIPSRAGDYTLKITAANGTGSSTTVTEVITVAPLTWTTHGTYNGLIGSLGSTISVQVQTTGTFTGSIYVHGIKTSFSGRLDATSGDPAVSGLRLMLHEPGGEVYPVTLSFTISIGSGRMEGTLTDDRGFSYEVTARPNLWSTRNPALDYAGYYTAAILPDVNSVDDPAYPQGNGILTISVTTAGLVRISGHAADGAAITGSTTLGPFGQMSLSNSFLNDTEVIQGWVQITIGAQPSLNTVTNLGDFLWYRNQPGTRIPAFITQSLAVSGGPWQKPVAGSIIFDAQDVIAPATNAAVEFTGANIGQAGLAAVGYLQQTMRLTTTGGAVIDGGVSANPAGVSVALNLTAGTFSGSFTLKDPNPLSPLQIITRKCTYSGVLLPGLNMGLGYFLLDQLPASPGDTMANTPMLSGAVELQTF